MHPRVHLPVAARPDRTFTVESSTCSRQTDQSVYRNVFSPDASHVPINGNRAILPASVLNLSKFRGRRVEKIATCVRPRTHLRSRCSAHLFVENSGGWAIRFANGRAAVNCRGICTNGWRGLQKVHRGVSNGTPCGYDYYPIFLK